MVWCGLGWFGMVWGHYGVIMDHYGAKLFLVFCVFVYFLFPPPGLVNKDGLLDKLEVLNSFRSASSIK